MSVDISIAVDVGDVIKSLKEEAAAYVKDAIVQIMTALRPQIFEIVGRGMRVSPEYESLCSGQLRTELGLGKSAGGQVEGKDAAESIIEAVQKSILIEKLPATDGFGGIFIGVFQDDFQDALKARWAEYISTNASGDATKIPWLNWLLFEGDAIILTDVELLNDYQTRRVSFRSSSRTGKAIMVRRSFEGVAGRYNRAKGRFSASGWGVPSQFAGIGGENWITRVAKEIGNEVSAVIQAEIVRF